MLKAYGLAVFAAFAYGYSAILQAQGARVALTERRSRLRAMLGQPRLVAGIALDLVAWVASRIALVTLPLFATQTILAGSIAITVVLASLILHTHLGPQERGAVVATCIGLVVIGLAAEPNHDASFADHTRIGIVLALPVITIVGLTLGRRFGPMFEAALAGLAFVGSAMAARTIDLDHGVRGVVTSPVAWSMVGYALCGTWLHALALGRGGTGQVTSCMWATEMLAAGAIGVLLLGETVRSGWAIPAAVAMAAVLGATIVLARSSAEVTHV